MKLFFTYLACLIPNIIFSQNLTFEQFENLRKKNIAEVETFLILKKWSMTSAEAPSDGKMGSATFGYEINQYDSKKAASWISYYESSIDSNYNRITIQINNSDSYSTYLNKLSTKNYKLITSKIADGSIEKVYSDAEKTCIVSISTSKGAYTQKTSYTFILLDNLDYKLQIEGKIEEKE